MAIYLVDRANRIPSIKAALTAAGVLTTVLFENSSNLIFTSPRSNKVIQITSNNISLIGTSWTSGTTITDSRTIDAGSSSAPDPFDWAIIVTPDVLAFVYKSGTAATGRCSSTIFTTTVDGSVRLALGHTSENGAFSTTYSYETTTVNLAPYIVPIAQYANALLVDSNGFYFATDIFYKYLTDNKLIPSPAKGIKAVLNGLTSAQGFFKFGNDIVVQGWYTNNTSNPMQANILITNGAV